MQARALAVTDRRNHPGRSCAPGRAPLPWRRLPRPLLAFTVLALGLAQAAIVTRAGAEKASTGAESRKVWSFKPATGFIDDPMAFDGTDSRFAFVHTDSSSFIKLVVLKLDGLSVESEIDLKQASLVPRSLVFTPDGKGMVMTFMDGTDGSQGAIVVGVPGGSQSRLGPARHAEVVALGGEQVVSLVTIREDRKGNQTIAVALHRTGDLKRVASASAVQQPDRTLKKPPLRVLYWEPGHTSLLGMRRGVYDKKRDIRLPDVAVRYDLVQGKEVWAESPQKLVEWTQATNLRPEHPGQYRFAHVSDDRQKIYLVERDNALGTTATTVAWDLYEAGSLVQHESWDGALLHYSMTIDPVNPKAVARKKADDERVDIYRVSADGKSVLLGRVLTDRKRGSTVPSRFDWTVGRDHLAYLAKLKGFNRGGKEVSIVRQDGR